MDLVRSLGAEHVIDYTLEDITRIGEGYDLIFDTAAYRSISDYKRILNPGGMYVLAGGSISRIIQLMFKSRRNKNMRIISAKVIREDLQTISKLLETGQIKSAIDKSYPLAETAAAMRYLELGHVRGKVVITV